MNMAFIMKEMKKTAVYLADFYELTKLKQFSNKTQMLIYYYLYKCFFNWGL